MLGQDWEIASRDLEPYARARSWWRQPERVDAAASAAAPAVPAARNAEPERAAPRRARRAALAAVAGLAIVVGVFVWLARPFVPELVAPAIPAPSDGPPASTVAVLPFADLRATTETSRTAERLNAEWVVMEAGHYPMLTHPEETARLLQG